MIAQCSPTLATEPSEDSEPQRLTRLIPAFNTERLKFKIRPRRSPVIRRYVNICATNTGSNLSTLFTSTTTSAETIRSGRYSPISMSP